MSQHFLHHCCSLTWAAGRRCPARTRAPAGFPGSGRAACWPSGWRPPEWPTGPSAPRIKAIQRPWIDHVLLLLHTLSHNISTIEHLLGIQRYALSWIGLFYLLQQRIVNMIHAYWWVWDSPSFWYRPIQNTYSQRDTLNVSRILISSYGDQSYNPLSHPVPVRSA